jgi:hypothetical protein
VLRIEAQRESERTLGEGVRFKILANSDGDGPGEYGSGPSLACNFGVAQELVKIGDDLTNELDDKQSRSSISRRG